MAAANSVWRFGIGPPANIIGANGDYYVDQTPGANNEYYKANGVYSVVYRGTPGPKGDKGDPGPAGQPGAGVVSVKSFGAIGDGLSHPLSSKYGTDLAAARVDYPFAISLSDELDWAGIQKAMNQVSAITIGGGADGPFLPYGKYLVNEPLSYASVAGQLFRGEGRLASCLLWTGTDPTKTIFDLSDVYRTTFAHFSVTTNSLVKSAFRSYNNPATNLWIPSLVTWEDVEVTGSSQRFTHAWDFDASYGVDANNELHRFVNCSASAYVTSAVHVKGSQVHFLNLETMSMDGQGLAPYGFYGETSCNVFSRGGSGGAHTAYDWFLGDASNPSKIESWDTEQSAALIYASGSSNQCSVTVECCRFASSVHLAADGYWAYQNNSGPMRLLGNHIEYGSVPAKVHYNGQSGYPVLLRHQDNIYKLDSPNNYPNTGAVVIPGGADVTGLSDGPNSYFDYVSGKPKIYP